MPELFGIDIAEIVNDALNGELVDATLTRENPGTYDPETDSYSGGSADSTYTTQGIVTKFSKYMYEQGAVQANDRKILLLAEDLGTEPSPGEDNRKPDTITIEGTDYTVVGAPERDPAGATWIIQGRI